jgi:hypothetical protein
MRAILCVTVLVAATPSAHADSFVDVFAGLSNPIGDDDWSDLVDSSPKFGFRVGAFPNELGGFLQADWTPVNTEAESSTFPGGSSDVSAHRFRILAGGMFHHHVSNLLIVTGRAGIGVDIARASATFEFLGTRTEVDDTDAGLGLEFGGGLFFKAGGLEVGGEIAFPMGFHDHEGGNDGIDFQYTSYDLDLMFCVRFLSR